MKSSFFSNKFQITTYFGFEATLAWKTDVKLAEKIFQSEWISPCSSEDGQTYIHRLDMCCLVTGWNHLFLLWNILYTVKFWFCVRIKVNSVIYSEKSLLSRNVLGFSRNWLYQSLYLKMQTKTWPNRKIFSAKIQNSSILLKVEPISNSLLLFEAKDRKTMW